MPLLFDSLDDPACDRVGQFFIETLLQQQQQQCTYTIYIYIFGILDAGAEERMGIEIASIRSEDAGPVVAAASLFCTVLFYMYTSAAFFVD